MSNEREIVTQLRAKRDANSLAAADVIEFGIPFLIRKEGTKKLLPYERYSVIEYLNEGWEIITQEATI